LFSGRNDPSDIIRGARIRSEYLCEPLKVPDDTDTPAQVVLPQQGSHRQLYAAKTETPGTACAACHTTMINPLGFSLTEFDALGRFRSVEPLFNPNTTPESKVGWTTVNAATQPRIDAVSDTTSIKNAVEFSALLGESHKIQGCYVRNYFRYAMGREEVEDSDVDGCQLTDMKTALTASDGGIRAMVRSLASSRAFTLRRFNQDE
jgi:hypothetical protein